MELGPTPARARLPSVYDCVHCGLCVPSCPTWAATGKEVESPRGRIAALRAIAEGRARESRAITSGLADCLVCRACESVCPSGISMEALMAGHRAARPPRRRELRARLIHWALRELIPHPTRLARFAAFARLGAPLLEAARVPIDLPARHRRRAPAPLDPPPPAAAERGCVTILRGCITDLWFRDETRAAAAVLARNGWRVEYSAPGCCGALHRHAGLADLSARLARTCAEAALARGGGDGPVIIDSAGCAAALREPLSGSGDAARELATRVTDTMSLLARHGWSAPRARIPGDWVVAPPCHQLHGGGDPDGTRAVLEAILECGYRELSPPAHCCGAAGFYLLSRPRLSRRIGAAALERFRASGARGVISANPGCLLRWESLLGRLPGTEAVHPTTVLERAYRIESPVPGDFATL